MNAALRQVQGYGRTSVIFGMTVQTNLRTYRPARPLMAVRVVESQSRFHTQRWKSGLRAVLRQRNSAALAASPGLVQLKLRLAVNGIAMPTLEALVRISQTELAAICQRVADNRAAYYLPQPRKPLN
jgi:hypothetical protein